MIATSLKCKNCGSDLDISTAVGNVVKCAYCGSVFTISNSSDEVKRALDFAENSLDVCEFDKAFSSFRKAAELNPQEPEAYFGMALATFKIQYLRDCRKDNGLQPICHDINDKKFSADANFLKALTLSTPEQRKAYKDKAAEIDRIKGEFSKLKVAGIDYDCFICVKVTDTDGRHTEDSHIAEKIYHSLKEAGYAPFYSEYDIHGQTGADYEARILYALFMSESMFLICTDESYLQTPWVKNEYTRFISMMSDEQKERESLTVIFKDTPIERIPGLAGRIQGISMNSFDALQRILNHVEAFRVQAVPEITRKEYSGATHSKKTAIRQTIAKRNLTSLGGSVDITVSDKSTLKNATAFLERGNFSAALNFADMLIKNNASNSAAYRLRFLAENECRTPAEYINRRVYTPSFDSLEKAIASADGKEQKKELYDLLYQRVQKTDDLDAYNEFVSLPDSTPKDVSALTTQMYSVALNSKNTEIFDSAIKTISDSDEYIGMNMEFARILPDEKALKYYKCVLDVDAGNSEALWHTFLADNGIKDIFAFFSKQENFEKIENELYGYGYNEYASERLFYTCTSNFSTAATEACFLADFLLSLIPKNKNAEFKNRLVKCRDELMALKKPSQAKRYNDRILTADKMNDEAHFYACLINHGFSNPISILRLGADVLNDSEFRAAFDIYPEKYPDKVNPYLDIYTFITENASLIKVDEAFSFVEDNMRFDMFDLKNCAQKVKDFYLHKADIKYNECLNSYNCFTIDNVYALRKDVSKDPRWSEALVFAEAYGACTGDTALRNSIKDIINNQAARCAQNIETDRIKEERRRQKIQREKRYKTKQKVLRITKILLVCFIYFCSFTFPVTMIMAPLGGSLSAAIWSGLLPGDALFAGVYIGGYIGIPILIIDIIGIVRWIEDIRFRKANKFRKLLKPGSKITYVSIVFSAITAILYIVSLFLSLVL